MHLEGSEERVSSVTASNIGAPAKCKDYVYEPLNEFTHEIRLMSFVSSVGSDIVKCSLQRLPYNDRRETKYTALSYTWGDESPEDPWIFIDDCKFQVRSNLYAFLRHAQHLDETTLFWIDALCIDQKSIEERNRQVRFMDNVYKDAENVLIWLGEDDSLEFSMVLRSFYDLSIDWDPGQRDFDCLWHLLNLDYWSRMWVVQEIWHARTLIVMRGSQTVSWQDFSNIVHGSLIGDAGERHWTRARANVHLENKTSFKDGVNQQDHLANLLAKYTGFKSKEIRDQVVALLSMTGQFRRTVDLYGEDDATWILNVCRTYAGSMDLLSRLANAIRVQPDQLVQAAIRMQAFEDIPESSRPLGMMIAVMQCGHGVMEDTVSPLFSLCASCGDVIRDVPQWLLRDCKVFCLEGVLDPPHLLLSSYQTSAGNDAQRIFFSKAIRPPWIELSDEDSDEDNEIRSASSRPCEEEMVSFSDPLCNGHLEYDLLEYECLPSTSTALITMSMQLFAYMIRFTQSHRRGNGRMPHKPAKTYSSCTFHESRTVINHPVALVKLLSGSIDNEAANEDAAEQIVRGR